MFTYIFHDRETETEKQSPQQSPHTMLHPQPSKLRSWACMYPAYTGRPQDANLGPPHVSPALWKSALLLCHWMAPEETIFT